MAKDTGFLKEAKTETKTAKVAKAPRAAKKKTHKVVKLNNTVKVMIPRNPMDAYKLGLMMARYQ